MERKNKRKVSKVERTKRNNEIMKKKTDKRNKEQVKERYKEIKKERREERKEGKCGRKKGRREQVCLGGSEGERGCRCEEGNLQSQPVADSNVIRVGLPAEFSAVLHDCP